MNIQKRIAEKSKFTSREQVEEYIEYLRANGGWPFSAHVKLSYCSLCDNDHRVRVTIALGDPQSHVYCLQDKHLSVVDFYTEHQGVLPQRWPLTMPPRMATQDDQELQHRIAAGAGFETLEQAARYIGYLLGNDPTIPTKAPLGITLAFPGENYWVTGNYDKAIFVADKHLHFSDFRAKLCHTEVLVRCVEKATFKDRDQASEWVDYVYLCSGMPGTGDLLEYITLTPRVAYSGKVWVSARICRDGMSKNVRLDTHLTPLEVCALVAGDLSVKNGEGAQCESPIARSDMPAKPPAVTNPTLPQQFGSTFIQPAQLYHLASLPQKDLDDYVVRLAAACFASNPQSYLGYQWSSAVVHKNTPNGSIIISIAVRAPGGDFFPVDDLVFHTARDIGEVLAQVQGIARAAIKAHLHATGSTGRVPEAPEPATRPPCFQSKAEVEAQIAELNQKWFEHRADVTLSASLISSDLGDEWVMKMQVTHSVNAINTACAEVVSTTMTYDTPLAHPHDAWKAVQAIHAAYATGTSVGKEQMRARAHKALDTLLAN